MLYAVRKIRPPGSRKVPFPQQKSPFNGGGERDFLKKDSGRGIWDLFPTMEGLNIEILVTRAKELYPESHARIIHDNGKQFTSREFLELVARLELKETSTSPFHPQSNGKIERMHRTFKTEEVRRDDYHGFIDAKEKMGGWVHGYNSERLHSAIGYLTPDEVFAGKTEERLAERREKMYNANKKRQAYWSNQQT